MLKMAIHQIMNMLKCEYTYVLSCFRGGEMEAFTNKNVFLSWIPYIKLIVHLFTKISNLPSRKNILNTNERKNNIQHHSIFLNIYCIKVKILIMLIDLEIFIHLSSIYKIKFAIPFSELHR